VHNVGHVLWNDSPPFYQRVSELILAFARADAQGHGTGWVASQFGPGYLQYPDKLSAEEVAKDLIDAVSLDCCSGIYRCPECGRIHMHVKGTENRWESYVREDRTEHG
jgi:hypothetical protein